MGTDRERSDADELPRLTTAYDGPLTAGEWRLVRECAECFGKRGEQKAGPGPIRMPGEAEWRCEACGRLAWCSRRRGER